MFPASAIVKPVRVPTEVICDCAASTLRVFVERVIPVPATNAVLDIAIAALALISSLTITPVPIAAVPVTLPLPSNEAEVHVTSPVIPIVLPVASAVAVVALPDNAPVNCVAVSIPEFGLYVNPVSDSKP